MKRIDIIFVDTLRFQTELDEKFGKGVFTVCVDRTEINKIKYVVYDETITENSEIQTIIPGCGGHDTIEITKFVCVTQSMISEVINMAIIHNKKLLEDEKNRLTDLLEKIYNKLLSSVSPLNENIFKEMFDDLSEWLKDKSHPYPLSLQIYAKEQSISCEEAIVLIQNNNNKKQNYITAIKNIKLQGKLELLDVTEYIEYKIKFNDIINTMENIQY